MKVLKGLCFLPLFLTLVKSDLSDFGGDVRQYMSLLQGTSAFSFSPKTAEEDSEREKRQELAGLDPASSATGSTGSPMGDFGGDYGDYLKLLESNSALGFNPQADPIGDNQDLQNDIFGGGATKKYWNMYKGSTTYDSFDDSDADVVQELNASSDDDDTEELLRISKEFQSPEDSPHDEKQRVIKKGKTIIVAYKPSKSKMTEIFDEVKDALKSKNVAKINQMIDLLTDKSEENKDRRETPKMEIVKETQSNDYEEEAYAGEAQRERSFTQVEHEWKDFAKKMISSTPDPVITSKGLSMSYKNLTLFGLSQAEVCGKIKKSFNAWKGYICTHSLTSTVDSVTGPGVPFKGRVAGIFKSAKVEFTFKQDSESGKIHVTSVHLTDAGKAKFVPTYDSSIPLNPWSKVSMSGYMVARIKKVMPSLVEKMILRISHVVEKLD